jgi:hypothetical protein
VGREMAGKFSLKMPDFHVAFRDLLHAANLRHGTDWFTSFPKGRSAEDIFHPEKSDCLRPGLNPRTLGSKGQKATSRLPEADLVMGC